MVWRNLGMVLVKEIEQGLREKRTYFETLNMPLCVLI